MIQVRHIENSDNLRTIKMVDQDFGRAAVRFANMVDDGTAFWPVRSAVPVPPLTNPKNEFPSNTPHMAGLSIERAKRQFDKGRLTLAERDEIIQRCIAVMVKG